MSDDAVTVAAWYDTLDRVRFGSLSKAHRRGRSAHVIWTVASAMAHRADPDTGEGIRPGLARVALGCELNYETVADAVRVLVDLGLLRLVRVARIRNDANEYRLAVPADLAEQVPLWSPSQYQAAQYAESDRRKGTYREPGAPRKQALPRSRARADAGTP